MTSVPRTSSSEENRPLLSSDYPGDSSLINRIHADVIELDDLVVSEYASRHSDDQFGGPEARQKLEKQLLRKLDLRMSILVVIYILNYIDRNSAAAARLRGFERDLGLEGSQFASILSILYVGYILMQIPSNMFLSHIGKPSIYLPCCMIAWGAISFCTGLTTNYHGALIARFLLGFVEAAFFPGALFLISKWYKRNELSQRTALLSCGSLISNAFGALISSAILDSMDGILGYTAWRWLFFVEGGLTVLVAILAIFILPDFPESNAAWLAPVEHALAQRRMIEDAAVSSNRNSTSSRNETSKHGAPMAGLYLALTDWKVWWLAAALTLLVASLSFNLYFPTLSATMGYNPTITLLLCSPPWMFATVVSLWVSRHSDRTNERCMHVVIPLFIGIGGFIMAMSTMNTAVRYLSLFLMAQSYAGFICFLAWASSTVSSPPAKRAVALAFINATSQSGNIFSSYMWPKSWGPTYNYSYTFCTFTMAGCIVMCFLFRRSLVKLNKQMDTEEERAGEILRGTGKGWRFHF